MRVIANLCITTSTVWPTFMPMIVSIYAAWFAGEKANVHRHMLGMEMCTGR